MWKVSIKGVILNVNRMEAARTVSWIAVRRKTPRETERREGGRP